MRILVTGSRTWTDRAVIATALVSTVAAGDPAKTVILIEGGALGADRLSREEAWSRGWHVATVKALWNTYGAAAGHTRNAVMTLLMQPPAPGDACLAFIMPCVKENCPAGPELHDSHGVSNCIAAARKAGMEVKEYREASHAGPA